MREDAHTSLKLAICGCSGGILQSISETLIAVVIPEGAHHLDLMFSHPDDPISVTLARKTEMAYITRWLASEHASTMTV